MTKMKMKVTEEQELCPYCHTDTIMTGTAGGMEVEVPFAPIFYHEQGTFPDKQYFAISLFILDRQLIIHLQDEGEFKNGPKINFCPMCGRRLNDED